jgi:hypothetical protein
MMSSCRFGSGPARANPVVGVSVAGKIPSRVMNFTITHVDHELAGISVVPSSNSIVDSIIPSIAKRCRSYTPNLVYAYSKLGGGIPELDDDQVGLRSDPLRNATSHGSDCGTMSVVIRHVFR